ncbi:hypothetical protein TWF281_002765 [Arthrobotrys megalospora]
MQSFFRRVGLKKRRPRKNATDKVEITEKAPISTTSAPGDDFKPVPTVSGPRRSFESRASGSIISIPRSTDPVDDFDDLKPWKRKKNKGKQANHNNETITEQMRRDFVALQHKIDRIEAHIVPNTAPPDNFTIDDKNSAVTNNDLRTFIDCAVAIYEEGKELNTEADSDSETPDDIRNSFVNALERCKDPGFLFKLSQKILRKYGTTYNSSTADTGPSERRDRRTNVIARARSLPQLIQKREIPRIEYRAPYETAVSEPKPSETPPAAQLQLALTCRPDIKPDPAPRRLVPVDTLLLQINAEKRQKGEQMPHLQVPFGPSHQTIGQADRGSQEPKYLGLHELYAENCIEKLTGMANEMAQLPRPYTENVALESTGSRPMIEAAVSQPNALTKPAEPSFKSSVEDLSIDDTIFETLSISKLSSTPSSVSIAQKSLDDSCSSFVYSDDPVVFPVSFDNPVLDETSGEDEQRKSPLELSIQPEDQNSQPIYQPAVPEDQREEQQIQIPNTDNADVDDDTNRISASSGCESSCLSNSKAEDDEEEEEEEEDDETAAQLSAIHLLILLKVLAKRQNETRSGKQTNRSTSNWSSSPSESSDGSQSSSNSSPASQNMSISNSNGDTRGGPSRKRSRENDKDNNGNDPSGPPQKKAAIEAMRDVLRRFACPLARGKPNDYPGCQMINRQNLSGLKEHVKRKHFNGVLPHGIRVARNWNEVFLHCNQGWTGPIPSPYISDMFRIANENQPFDFEPSVIEPANHGSYRQIAPLIPSTPTLGGMDSDIDVSGPLSLSIPQIHNIPAVNYSVGSKPEPSIGQEMIDFLSTDEFRSIFNILPPHLQSLNLDEFEAVDLENYMQSTLGIDVSQTRSQLMTPEFTNSLNLLLQQAEVNPQDQPKVHNHQQDIVPPNQTPSPSPPTIKLQIQSPNYGSSPPEIPSTSETATEQDISFVSAELLHGLGYLFTDAKPYLKNQRLGTRISTSSLSSSSTSPPLSSSSSVLVADPGTLTPDTLLSERDPVDLPLSRKSSTSSPIKKSPKKKKYTLRIRHKPPGPKQCSTFSFNDDNEYMELKLGFGAWMTQSFFPGAEFSWETCELEDTVYNERICSMKEFVEKLQFTWPAFRTTEAAFFLVPKQPPDDEREKSRSLDLYDFNGRTGGSFY